MSTPAQHAARLIAGTDKDVTIRDRDHLVSILGVADDGHATFNGARLHFVPDGENILVREHGAVAATARRDPFNLKDVL